MDAPEPWNASGAFRPRHMAEPAATNLVGESPVGAGPPSGGSSGIRPTAPGPSRIADAAAAIHLTAFTSFHPGQDRVDAAVSGLLRAAAQQRRVFFALIALDGALTALLVAIWLFG